MTMNLDETNETNEILRARIVHATLDEQTCEFCRWADGKTVGELVATGQTGPPFHKHDPTASESPGDCRCVVWGVSPARKFYEQRLRERSFDQFQRQYQSMPEDWPRCESCGGVEAHRPGCKLNWREKVL